MSFENIYSQKRRGNSNFRYWCSSDDVILVESYYKGYSISQISFILNRSYSSVYCRLSSLGLKYKSPYSNDEKNFFISSVGKITVTEMARISGRSFVGICYFLNRNGFSCKTYGDNHHNVKHSDSDVLLMRQLYDEGVSISDIADKFDISYGTAKELSRPLSRRKLSSDYLLNDNFKSKDKRANRNFVIDLIDD